MSVDECGDHGPDWPSVGACNRLAGHNGDHERSWNVPRSGLTGWSRATWPREESE